MDFHSLSRKELQTLCKKNKIPANITNVAMADALAALNQVEGLDEFLNPREGDAGTPNVHHRTACRTSTQRKAVREEAEGSKVKVSTLLQRGTRAGIAEGVVEQENKDANVPVTPAMIPGSRRRATAVSTRRKNEFEMLEYDDDKNGEEGKPADMPKTPAAAPGSRKRATGRSVCTKIETPSGSSVQRAYNTRRSVRLLEKNLSKMSLMDTEDMGLAKIVDVSEELTNVSPQVEDSSDTEKGASLQTGSTVVSENTHELEVSSLDKNTEYECQSHDSGSDVKLVCVTENETEDGLQAEPQEAAESHDSNLKLEGSYGSNEAGSELPVLEESCDSSELETENKECFGARQDSLPVEASKDAIPEVTVVVPDDVSVDVAGSLPMSSVNDASVNLKELAACNIGQGSSENDVKEDKNIEPPEEAEPCGSNLKLEGSSDTRDDSDEAGSLEESCDSSELEMENKECVGAMQDTLPVEASEDALMEVIATVTVVVPEVPDDVSDQDVAGLFPISSVNDAQVSLKEFFECNIDVDQGSNEGDDNQDKNNETEQLNVADGNYQHPLNVDEKAADEGDLASSEGVLEQQEEELEAKPEQSEETGKIDNASDVTGTSSVILAVQKDCENSLAVIDVCTESSADRKEMEVKNVTRESSLLEVEAEDHKNNFENLEAEAQAEESEERVAGEDIVLDADNAFSSVLDGMGNPQIPIVHQHFLVESAGSNIDSCPLDGVLSCKSNTLFDGDGDVVSEDIAIPKQEPPVSSEPMTVDSIHEAPVLDSCPLDGVLSCKSNTLVDGDVVSEDIAIPKQEPKQEPPVSSETMTVDSVHEQKTSDIPVQSVVSDQLKGDMHIANMMKENQTTEELHNKSIGELKRLLKKLTLDEKSNCKTNNVVKEVEKKRTALQVLPQNRMTTGEAQNDGGVIIDN